MSLISGDESKIFAKGVIGNVRKAQEDSHGYKIGTPNGDLFVVCDGMGGHVGGAMASRIAVDSIIEYIGKECYDTPVAALDGALQFANMQILGYANEHPEYRGMGTTACIVLMQGNGVWIAHVGDSRIYLYLGKEKQLHRITKDHSYVQTLVDAGQITDEEAEHHPNKNRIMKALGIKPELQPTYNFGKIPIMPKKGDVFLICSDGLSGMIPDSTIERVLSEKDESLHDKGEKLIELAMQGETVQPGGQDNCTVELIEIDRSVGKKSVFHSYNPSPKKQKTKKKNMILAALIVLGTLAVIFGVLVSVKPNFGPSNDQEASPAAGDTMSDVKTDTINEGQEVVNDTIIAKQRFEEISKEIQRIQDTINDLDKQIKGLQKEIGTIRLDDKPKFNELTTLKKRYENQYNLAIRKREKLKKEQAGLESKYGNNNK